MEWLRFVLNSSDFIPRGACGHWDVFHRSLYFWSNFGIACEYILMPLSWLLIASVIRRQHLDQTAAPVWLAVSPVIVIIPVASFVLMCGIGHFLDNVGAFAWPAYRFFAWWHFATFLVGTWAGSRLVTSASKQVTAQAARQPRR
jgi:hypothetical protein